jgi:putative ABC transport system permease protein
VDASAVYSPPGAGDNGDWFYSIPGRPAPAQNELPLSLFNIAEPGYFRMMRIPIRQGREFAETDRASEPKIAIVNETFARQWWPNEPAVGHQIKVGGPYQKGDLLEIVGVAGDVKQFGLDSQPMPEIYQPSAQKNSSAMTVLIRANGSPAALAPSIRRLLAGRDRNLPLLQPGTMEEALGAGLARRRFSTLLLTLFAALAMLLAAVGIYGLLSYWVTSREPEIAIRLALGARRFTILRWTSLQAVRLALAGLAFGILGGWAAARGIAGLVFGIPPRSPGTMAAAALAVMLLALGAAAIPSWRAARIDAARRLHSA